MTDANTPDRMEAAENAEGGPVEPLPVEEAATLVRRVVENVETVIVGHHDQIEHLMTGLLARGHLLLEDVPGVGKTMLARSVARSFDCTFKRVQFTPDLLPTDVTGVNVFNQKSREFEFRPGPVFANIVLGDEINRAPPKTQSALLEAMEEGQVTVDGVTRDVPKPFTVIATQNTVEPNRTYELPMAEIDRFLKKLTLGYPDAADESRMLDRVVGQHPIEDLDPIADVEDLQAAIGTAMSVTVEEPVREYATRLARFTREEAALGVSPRGSIALLRAAQGRAILDERDFVIPDDVQAEAVPVMAHRIRTDEGAGRSGGRDLVETALERVSVD